MDKENDSGSFTVKYTGTANPLIISLPSSEYKGNKYIDIEVGAFFWNYGLVAGSIIGGDWPVPIVSVIVPGVSTNNYDINGQNTNTMTMIAPEVYQVYPIAAGSTSKWQAFYTYSPGRPDIYLVPPMPQIKIEFRMSGALIDFAGSANPYYASFNIGF